MTATVDSSSKLTLFEDIFEISAINPEGKKFDAVNRLAATGTTFECDLLLDYNSDIYNSLRENDKFTFLLASTLYLDGSPADHFSYSIQTTTTSKGGASADSMSATLMDNYDYVCHGRVFDLQFSQKEGTMIVAASFGGLLMRLSGDPRHLSNILPDQRLYLLIKKD